MRKAILASAFTTVSLVAIAGFTPAAQAQQQATLCGLRDDMGTMLDQRFGEQPQAGGIVGDRIVELLVSQTGSWTILITSADGRSCVVTGGDDWTDQPVTSPSKVKADKVKLESTL
ncbi:hypothetical protein FNB15_11745 [Ferrovibrio terrae]|uniref:Uncharacterized protein n=1 Tax=Ferrovibrio terrae TaxID=2594003 RepID=A0A516H2A2_9PROT|nr:hypothetical protein [Ferrovibrio terrae]QDO97897.1 hypothetical protein FNB15_11745 [Ferrovibrio terrae]